MKFFTTKQPQSKNRVTQKFWERPEYYRKYGFLGHEGLDLNDTPWVSTPVYAVQDGTIVVKQNDGAYGLRVDLYDLDLDVIISYCHLSKAEVQTKQNVKAGDLIGYTGNTSTVKMPIHLHIMVKEIDLNLDVINTRNGYAGSVECWIENWKFYFMKTQIAMEKINGVPVELKENIPGKNIIARVYQGFEKIFITPLFFSKTELERKWTILHEYCHILFNRASKKEQEEYEKLFLQSWEKDFISKYAKTNFREDFAEMGKIYFLEKSEKWNVIYTEHMLRKKDFFEKIHKKYS